MEYNNYLIHHGIKGQKWGIENGPPYPLNDVIKAIAYKGGELDDGRKAINFTEKDVKKARRIVDKNIKSLTEKELQEYKSRLLLEKDMATLLGKDPDLRDNFRRNLKKSASDAVSDSLKTVGTKVLTNAEMSVIDEILSNTLGPDIAAMITNGLSKYDIADKKYQKEKDTYQRNKDKQAREDMIDERNYQRSRDPVKDANDRAKTIAALHKAYNKDNAKDIDDIIDDVYKDIYDDDDDDKKKKQK